MNIKEPERFCVSCKKKLVRKVRTNGRLERLSDFKKRTSCGNHCKRVTVSKNPCRACGAKLVRKRSKSGNLESALNYKNRLYCDSECFHAHKSRKAKKKKESVVSVREFPACKPPEIINHAKASVKPNTVIAPSDATHKNEFGYFKIKENRVFRHDGSGWALSSKTEKSFTEEHVIKNPLSI